MRADDRRLQGSERQADDCLSLPLRADQSEGGETDSRGALGQVQAIESSFGFNIGPGEWRLNKKLAGGGPLFDVGIYSLNACRYLTGEEPQGDCRLRIGDRPRRALQRGRREVSWTMRFPSGVVASCTTTYGAHDGWLSFSVQGSKGWLEADPAFIYEGLRLRGEFSGTSIDEPQSGARSIAVPGRSRSLFPLRAEQLGTQSPGEEGLRDMRYITQIYRSAGIAI